ncbi:RecB-like helicase [Campylobacter fetus]|uniref:RecB-like helicase n=1 Tax=Campylobacter fetus TaxID=196 RepID=UPI000FCB5348|nr:RecB-like helicase [Campylobacter fetus]RUT49968.1 hypothetical protein BWK67_06400 [Campylobacter fetus]RUT50229.1 hypothetical protein BWK51_06380 [Campylobacter fetus]
MSFSRYLALEASAGSGKTFALSVRFIALILQGNDITKILALTFTKKAANEMKSRIIDAFCNLHESSKKNELNELEKILELSAVDILSLRDKYMVNFLKNELKISTFDSFFTMILRQFSLNLGIMPDFKAGTSLNGLTRSEFIKNLKQNHLLESFAFYIKETNSNKNRVFETLELLYENISLPSFGENSKIPDESYVFAKFSELKSLALEISSDKNFLKNFEANTVSQIAGKPLIKEFDSKKYFEKAALNAKFMMIRDELISNLKKYYLEYEQFKINELLKFIYLYKYSRFEAIKKENALDFIDVTRLVYELLGNIDSDMLYFRLDDRIKHILIDEFQDTNIIQYDILLPLIEETLSGSGQNDIGSFFYVGDIKQSIYRFRGGRKELFSRLRNSYKQIETLSLESNYRSAKNIVNFVNQTFSNKIKDYKTQLSCLENEGYVEVCEFVSDEFYDTLLQKIEFFVKNGVGYDDIAILCWKNSDIINIKDKLEKSGVPVATGGSNLLINSVNVRVILDFIKYCLFGDEIYIYSVHEFIGEKKSKLSLNATAELASTLKFVASYLNLECFDKNLLKLYEVSLGYADIFDFIFNIQNDQTPSADTSHCGITLLTVHKSKGLEFDHVIVADRLSRAGSNIDVFITEYNNSEQKWDIKLNDSALQNLGDNEFINLKQKCKDLDYEEDINKLYVALTRAKNSLIVMSKLDSNGLKPSYFKAFTSSKEQICYLDLKPFSVGKIEPSKTSISFYGGLEHLEEFEIIKKQAVSDKQNDEYELNLESIYFGEALHYCLEMIFDFEEENLKNAKTAMINQFGAILSKNSIEDIINRVLNLINSAEFKNIIKDKNILKEQDIAFNQVIKRLDLLCIGDDEIVVMDYKSSKKFITQNEDQVREYMSILSQIYPQKRVVGKIIYLLNDKVEFLNVDLI